MRFRLLHPGSRPSGPLELAATEYRKRLERYVRTEEVFVKPAKITRGRVRQGLATEAERLLRSVRERDLLIALDVQGRALSSERLAARIRDWMNHGDTEIAWVLGSAWGLDDSVLERATLRLSFGPVTLPHDLARVVLWEQLYRSMTIIRGEPYHKRG